MLIKKIKNPFAGRVMEDSASAHSPPSSKAPAQSTRAHGPNVLDALIPGPIPYPQYPPWYITPPEYRKNNNTALIPGPTPYPQYPPCYTTPPPSEPSCKFCNDVSFVYSCVFGSTLQDCFKATLGPANPRRTTCFSFFS